MKNTIVVTGAAGFIGYHVCTKLINEGFKVIGIDNLNDYYDENLKKSRLSFLVKYPDFEFHKINITDKDAIFNIFSFNDVDYIINLAAQPGVRYSITNPQAYIDSNIQGFINILETARNFKIKHLLYASSSSVYGANSNIPFSVHSNVDHPMSLYAATKKSNELMAHTYSSLFSVPTTGLRFFTVYGPWGRPDMALFLFTKAIFENRPIDVFNNGNMLRDFTYIDDIVEGVFRLIKKIPSPNIKWDSNNPDPGSSYAPYKLYNIGNNSPMKLMEYIKTIEKSIGKKASINFMPLQDGDVLETYADVTDLVKTIGYKPQTTVSEGVHEFVKWYKEYYKI